MSYGPTPEGMEHMSDAGRAVSVVADLQAEIAAEESAESLSPNL